ncbi:MAG: YHS domain-containing protein [Armatimonadota bacterium]|nr:YHS domain-containing protein [Armatimonadota bacterium]
MANNDAGHDVWTDPVSHVAVDPDTAKHRSFYAGKMYHFADLVNKRTFDEDPQLWIPTPHASETSASLSPGEGPE